MPTYEKPLSSPPPSRGIPPPELPVQWLVGHLTDWQSKARKRQQELVRPPRHDEYGNGLFNAHLKETQFLLKELEWLLAKKRPWMMQVNAAKKGRP